MATGIVANEVPTTLPDQTFTEVDAPDETCSEVVRGFPNVKPSDLNAGEDTADNERCGNEILGCFGIQICCTAENERRRDDTSKHGQSMLETTRELMMTFRLNITPEGRQERWEDWNEGHRRELVGPSSS